MAVHRRAGKPESMTGINHLLKTFLSPLETSNRTYDSAQGRSPTR